MYRKFKKNSNLFERVITFLDFSKSTPITELIKE